MKNLITKIVLSGTAIAVMSGCGPASYNDRVNVVAVGAGHKPKATDRNYVDDKKLPDVQVYYTPNLKIKEQNASATVKYIAGDALVKEYSGEPKLMVDYLKAYHSFDNMVLILDKNGVVAWSGAFKGDDIRNAQGVYDYGITGAKFISFDEAMEKFVIDEDEAEFDEDKKIKFPTDNKSSFLAGFSYAGKYPLLMTKLPDMKFGKTSLSEIRKNHKPTVIVFFMAADEKQEKTLANDINKVQNLMGFVTGSGSSDEKIPAPQKVLTEIEKIYFKKQK